MMIMKLKLDCWGIRERAKKGEITQEQWDAARAAVPYLDLPKWEDIEGYWNVEEVVTDQELAELSRIFPDMNWHLSRVRGMWSNVEPRAVAQDLALASRGVNITIQGGVGLMEIAEVDLLEDCCTDFLRDRLQDGWRIIAVCPPNDARRPTYIIGHTMKDQRLRRR